MKLSRNWIGDYVALTEEPKPMGIRMTMATAEIEGVEPHGDDFIYDIDNKSLTHRPDLWGHYGFAREVAAVFRQPLRALDLLSLEGSASDPLAVSVQVGADLCPRYNGLVITGVKVGPSPDWLVKKLEAVGGRPINNIVDLTNFVLYELGQPMHAFDRAKLRGDLLQVRAAHEGESIKTLDGGEHTLSAGMLVIADAEGPTAIAGVMGGADSEVDETTTTIVLESANFHPTHVRRTAAKLGIRTESSMRFEKGLDPVHTEVAMQRFWLLLKGLCPDAQLVSPLHDIDRADRTPIVVNTTYSFINRKLGTTLPEDEIADILTRLGFQLASGDDALTVTVPSWRATGDISIPEDLVEEVGRVFGYDNITPLAPEVPLKPALPAPLHALQNRLRNAMSRQLGFVEVYNYAFVGDKLLEKVGLSAEGHLALANPLASDHNLLRTSLVPNMLKITAENLRHYKQFRIYELERVFHTTEQSPDFPHESFALCGLLCDTAWKGGKPEAFYSAKGVVEGLFEQLPIAGALSFKPAAEASLKPWAHPGRSADIYLGEACIGSLTQLHPRIAANLGISAGVSLFDLNVTALLALPEAGYHFGGVSKYPSVPFDVSMVCDSRTLIADVEACMQAVDPLLITDIRLFDVYSGPNLGEGKKSLAFTLTFSASDRTLGPDEITVLQNGVMDALDAAGYAVRKG
jgi:phenylalanyl-tRNA synthetase beta chain